MDLYKKLCSEYDLSHAQQCNRLLSGRLKLAIAEARQELEQGKACTHG